MKQMEAMSVNDDKMLKQGTAQETAENILSDNDDMDDDTGDSIDETDITEKDLPKRVLAFTSQKLLSVEMSPRWKMDVSLWNSSIPIQIR